MLSRTAKTLDNTITIGKVGNKPALDIKIFAVMGLNIKQGDTVSIVVDGSTMEWLFKNYL